MALSALKITSTQRCVPSRLLTLALALYVVAQRSSPGEDRSLWGRIQTAPFWHNDVKGGKDTAVHRHVRAGQGAEAVKDTGID